MKILMIEDNESVSEMMQMFFLNEGCAHAPATNHP